MLIDMMVHIRTRAQALCLGAIAGILIAGCAQNVNDSSPLATGGSARSADDLLVVDCLLPGQVRKLGQMMTYVAARQALKTTALDCGIRGGEYTAYDRGNYATALKVWLPLAEQGDRAAQNYVGEIYEKGLGAAPDYALAAAWYRKAAERGDARSQLNIGYLSEKGLGVKKDPVEALNWYRKASGMSGNIALDTGELQALRQEVTQRKRTEETLRRQLEQTRGQLEKAQKKLQRRRDQAAGDEFRWQKARETLERERRQAASQGDDAKVTQLEGQIRQRAEEVERQRQDMARLENEAQRYRRELAQIEDERSQLKALKQEVAQQKGESASLRQQLEAAQQQLTRAQTDLDQSKIQAAAEQQRVEIARQELEQQRQQAVSADKSVVNKLETRLEQREAELARQQQEVKRLTGDTERYQGRIAALERVQPTPATKQPEVSVVGPKIEIIDPPVSLNLQRASIPNVRTRSGIDRPIVGKVSSSAGILTLTINDKEEKVDAQGLFRTQVPVMRSNTPVNVVAVDKQGKRASIEFLFVSDQAEPQLLAKAQPPEDVRGPTLLPITEFGTYYALIIGNNAYTRLPKLETAVNDANAIGALLSKHYGFKVTTLVNANRYAVISALSGMREKLTENDNLFVYYAGHGELDKVNQRGHWLPVDAEPGSTANWISNIDITDILNVMSAKHVLVVADSCYSGTLTRSSLAQLEAGLTRDAKINWLKTMTQKRSRTAMTSGGVVPVLDAGGGKHSVFAKALLEVLEANSEVIEGSRLYREVAARVAYAATRFQVEQVPEYAPIKYSGHDFGDFFFVPVATQVGMLSEYPSP